MTFCQIIAINLLDYVIVSLLMSKTLIDRQISLVVTSLLSPLITSNERTPLINTLKSEEKHIHTRLYFKSIIKRKKREPLKNINKMSCSTYN